MKEIKYLTKETFMKIKRIEQQRKLKFNRSINEAAIKIMPPEMKFPISVSYLHNDEEIRAMVVFTPEGHQKEVDMPIDLFNKLPTIKTP